MRDLPRITEYENGAKRRKVHVLKQHRITYRDECNTGIQGFKQPLRIKGTNQLWNIPDIEFANENMILPAKNNTYGTQGIYAFGENDRTPRSSINELKSPRFYKQG